MWDVKVKITPINKDLKIIEINGEKSKFIFDPYSKSKNRTNFKGSFFSEIKRFRNNIKNNQIPAESMQINPNRF